jgi:hypothetical protein
VIIQARDATLLLVTQPDHAALSGRIMEQWRDGGFPSHPRRESILLAIREHDNGWQEVDRAPLFDASTHGLLDFASAPAGVRRAIWPRGVNRLAGDPWAAALVAQHAVHVYRHYRGDPRWAPFFQELEALRRAHLARARGLTFDDLLADYFFVRMGDLLSLTFCNGWQEAPEQPGYAICFSDSRLIVTPDPFAGRTIAFSAPARALPQRPFESEQEARDLFLAAPVNPLEGVIQPHP